MPAADPWTAFAGNFGAGLGNGVGQGVSDLFGGGGGPFVGGASGANTYGTTQDGSGWIVNIGGQQNATASPVRTSSNNPALYDPGPQWAGAAGGGLQSAGVSGVVALLLLAVAVPMLLRKRG